ncbi:hypothetical protein N431DRAFT_426744 [Stipitochalara longipes BDJ]|nr:hypothetical protein N431DRAFT_426744 [Stipitochalara longipes BDJ]
MSEIQGLPPPETEPEKAIPLPLPTPPSNPIPSLRTLRNWLPLYLSKTDATIAHLSRVLSTPSGTDTFLLTICYTSLLGSSLLSSLSLHRIRAASRRLISQAIALPPNTTVIINTSSLPSSRLLIASRRLKALSELISDFRIFVRLWGLLSIYNWGKRVYNSPPIDTLVRRIVYTQVISNIAYQYLENGAYLASKGVLGWSKEKQTRAWVWSSRFWMLHVGLDFVRLWREARLRALKGKSSPWSDEENKWTEKWRREMVVNAAWAPLTLHWSLEEGFASEFWVGVLGSVAGLAGFRELWRTTRKV